MYRTGYRGTGQVIVVSILTLLIITIYLVQLHRILGIVPYKEVVYVIEMLTDRLKSLILDTPKNYLILTKYMVLILKLIKPKYDIIVVQNI